MPKSKKFYAVFAGRQTGLFFTWPDCEAQVKGYQGARYKSFPTRDQAEVALTMSQATSQTELFLFASQVTPLPRPGQTPPDQPTRNVLYILDSLSVDASCLGNPGDVEYRGVHTGTKEVLFAVGPLAYGTNNIGEFLAIVDGLQYLQAQGLTIPIYSDSATGMSWVKKKRVQTKLARRPGNQEIFTRIDEALAWLHYHTYPNPILKWDTVNWGEIPADYGRKSR
ncbi:viroplasmin family protein [Synechococcus sp. PCC 6312]|uniref:ribonuclease H1 domain-containing protein n=1 Tax=Synechococcus sp. (strain ATCC 27167 / PCC 6312) TaxID=195253 RepID=UPI00029F3C26|nr:viroplasmin family protein [Synechococcus sp. PCC 6312]AFY61446.1 putative double-stranded RNA/RNA-DNA hybrid binding protein [Synechococcus sp. PCC 6312]